jgi:hypothetical protein
VDAYCSHEVEPTSGQLKHRHSAETVAYGGKAVIHLWVLSQYVNSGGCAPT